MSQSPIKHIHVIINPASGQDEPMLNVLNAVLQPTEIKWDVFVTTAGGDARKYAEQAVAAGVDAVAVYGGDGTVTGVASGMIGSAIPLAILPGGTANVMSIELGIPRMLNEAVALIIDPTHAIRLVDMGMVGDVPFFGHVAIGLEADMHETADRAMKDRLGMLAYPVAAFQALFERPVSLYTVEMDGETVAMEVLDCIVTNLGSIGILGASIANNVSISDGLLDVFLIRKADMASLGELLGSVTGIVDPANLLPHWQVRNVKVVAEPPQKVTADGELLGDTPVDIRVLPGAIRIIVPASAMPQEA